MNKTRKMAYLVALILITTSMIVMTVGSVAAQAPIPKGLKIGYFVSTMNNGFHQAHATWAKKYAMEKYGADLQVFDGKGDAAVMATNFDQAVAQGMDMVSLQIWQGESVRPAAKEALDNKMVITTYFDKIPDVAVPHVMPGEAQISEEMGKIAAEQWLKAHPDKPIVFVSIGWPDNEGVSTGRTIPFAKGVKSVAPDATDLGCMDGSKGADAAFKVTQDLVQAHPDLNIIYSEAADLTVGTLPALQQLGRGKMDNGVPLTEILVSVDCPENELISIFDPSSSLKMSMGLPPKETAMVRVDTMMKVYSGEIKQLDPTAETIFVPNKLIGYWSQKDATEAVNWYNDQFGASMAVPTYGGAPAAAAPLKEISKGLKIGYFVSTLNNGFHQAHATWAKNYAMEKYGADLQVFDGKGDAAVMATNFDQAVAQGMDMVSLQIWQGESVRPAAKEALDNKMVITTYFDKIPDVPVPHVMPGEAQISEEMGKIAAEQWLKAHPDKPIVFVSIGWPDNEGVSTGRTIPFAKGVKSVAPDATDLGCMDGSKGADAAFKVTQDLVQAHPDLNIIYSEAADLTVGTLPALQQLGRGKMDNGVPLTEILVSVDCPENELISIFDPSSSLKMSMGLPPKETAMVRVDTMMKVYTGEIKQLDPTAETIFVPNKLIGYWSQKDATEAVNWYNEEFGGQHGDPDLRE